MSLQYQYKSLKTKLGLGMGDDPKVSIAMASKGHYDKQLGELYKGYSDPDNMNYQQNLKDVYKELDKFRDKDTYNKYRTGLEGKDKFPACFS